MYHPNPEEMRRLVRAINPRSPFGQRDLGWIILCLHTGLRVAELVSLNVGQVIDTDGNPRQHLSLPGPVCKGKRGRVVPLNPTAQKAIRSLVAFNRRRGFSVAPKAPLLVNRKHRRLSTRAARYVLEKYRKEANLDTPISPHSLRHVFATSILAKTGNVRVTQNLLGHKRLSTTAAYTHVQQGDLEAAVATIG